METRPGAHAVDEVIDDLDAAHRRREISWPDDVAGDDLDPPVPGASFQTRPVTDQTSHAVSEIEQARHEAAADVTRCAGDEHQRSDSRRVRLEAGSWKLVAISQPSPTPP